MQSQSQSALPNGWVEHFDSQRKIWYYVDLDSDPPRVAFVHPSESQTTPSSAPGRFAEPGTRTPPMQRPAGPRESASPASSLRPTHRRPRRATVAQQLYASSLPANHSRETLLSVGPITTEPSSESTSTQGTDSDTPNSEITASSSSSSPSALSPPPPNIRVSTTGANSKSFTATSPTSPTQAHLDVRNPRHMLDCTRLAGTRRVTYSGPQPRIKRHLAPVPADARLLDATSTAPPVDAQSLYHHSTRMATPSPNSLTKSRTAPAQPATDAVLPIQSVPTSSRRQNMKSAATTSNEITGSQHAASGSSLPPSRLKPTVALSKLSPSLEEKGYTAIVSDDLSLNPKFSADTPSRPTLQRLNIKDVSSRTVNDSVPCPRPLPSISTRTIGENNSSHTSQTSPQQIAQPKPIRPMAGVTLNLQVQVATVSQGLGQEGGEDNPALKRKLPLLTSFRHGLSSKAKGKMPIRTIQDAESMDISPVAETFDPQKDSPFLLG
ncbi:hypothetical protein D9619_003108 [Psilocybe cf. subviscida]|uniref:WW domain-containing protein n=1 Tax=Psilocybe cf. subviscida TaxID=2480587 RepID=A0A8H5AWE3_9AGAR|nr:hypothetical protein D9619_003108 [Psilocybe cf. subviscida]